MRRRRHWLAARRPGPDRSPLLAACGSDGRRRRAPAPGDDARRRRAARAASTGAEGVPTLHGERRRGPEDRQARRATRPCKLGRQGPARSARARPVTDTATTYDWNYEGVSWSDRRGVRLLVRPRRSPIDVRAQPGHPRLDRGSAGHEARRSSPARHPARPGLRRRPAAAGHRARTRRSSSSSTSSAACRPTTAPAPDLDRTTSEDTHEPWTSPRSTSPAASRRPSSQITDVVVGDGAEATAGQHRRRPLRRRRLLDRRGVRRVVQPRRHPRLPASAPAGSSPAGTRASPA